MYLFFLGKPEAGQTIRLSTLAPHHYAIPSKVKRITLLESGVEAEWELTAGAFYLTIPDAEMNGIATVFKLELE